jgi:molybdopterin-containing oxidoreductase family iron-sulfur binding subunit
VDATRRRLLAGLGATAVLTLAPGVILITGRSEARPPGTAAPAATRWGLLIDVNKCTEDCTACITACQRENGWQDRARPATDVQWIRKVNVREPHTGARRSLPVLCQHCAQAPCVYVCPTGASFRRADGIVLVDKHVCIGCRYCMMACPFAARSFVHEDVTDQRSHAPRGKGTVESCTFCVHRVDEGRTPACVEACAGAGRGALTFGDLNDPTSAIAREVGRYVAARLRVDLGLDPGVLYRGL